MGSAMLFCQLLLLSPLLALGKRACVGTMGRLPGRDVDFGKNLETLRNVPNEGACFRQCLNYDTASTEAPHGCLASTYLPETRTCYLKAVSVKDNFAQPACKICGGSALLYCKARTFTCQSYRKSYAGKYSLFKNKNVSNAKACVDFCNDTPGCTGADFHMLYSELEYSTVFELRSPRPRGSNCWLKTLPAGIEYTIGDQGDGAWPIGPEIRDYFEENRFLEAGIYRGIFSWSDTLFTESSGYGCDCNVAHPEATGFGITECPARLGLSCQSGKCACMDGWYWNADINQCLNPLKCRAPQLDYTSRYDMRAASKRVASSGECALLCIQTPRCTAAAWAASKASGTNCYLKSAPSDAAKPVASVGVDLLYPVGSPVPCGAARDVECNSNADCATKGGLCINGACGCPPAKHETLPGSSKVRYVDRPAYYDATRGACGECSNYKQCPDDADDCLNGPTPGATFCEFGEILQYFGGPPYEDWFPSAD